LEELFKISVKAVKSLCTIGTISISHIARRDLARIQRNATE